MFSQQADQPTLSLLRNKLSASSNTSDVRRMALRFFADPFCRASFAWKVGFATDFAGSSRLWADACARAGLGSTQANVQRFLASWDGSVNPCNGQACVACRLSGPACGLSLGQGPGGNATCNYMYLACNGGRVSALLLGASGAVAALRVRAVNVLTALRGHQQPAPASQIPSPAPSARGCPAWDSVSCRVPTWPF
jgi:hypothetical protein